MSIITEENEMRTKNTFNDLKEQLTENDIDQLIAILGKGLRMKNAQLLRRRLLSHTGMIPAYGILERLTKESHGWSYCAGQSYVDEIRTVRSIILTLK